MARQIAEQWVGRYNLVVFTDPIAGREAEYNSWYNGVHLADVAAVPGVASARRLEMKTRVGGRFSNRYLAIYEFDSDDPEAVMDEINRRSGTPAMKISDALDLGSYNVAIFEACSGVDVPLSQEKPAS